MRSKPHLVRVRIEDESGRVRDETVRADALKRALPTTAPHESLPDWMVAWASQLWDRIGHLVRPSLTREKWIDVFRFDSKPAQEMAYWDAAFRTFEKLWQEHPACGKLLKIDLLCAVVAVLQGTVDVPSQVPTVTDAMVKDIRTTLSDEFKAVVKEKLDEHGD